MRLITKVIIAFVLCAVAGCVQAGSVTLMSDTLSLTIFFPKGLSRIIPDFRDNASRMDDFADAIKAKSEDSSCIILSVAIASGASPEGGESINNSLSLQRLDALRDYLIDMLPRDFEAEYHSDGADWAGLERMTEASSMVWREDVLRIIRDKYIEGTGSGDLSDKRLSRLKLMKDGSVWCYMTDSIFPDLRCCKVQVVWQSASSGCADSTEDRCVMRELNGYPIVTSSIVTPIIEHDVRPLKHHPVTIALSTNLIYDAMLIPSVAIDAYFGCRMSAGAAWMYGWKERHASRPVYAYGGELHSRFRFGHQACKPFTGHHLGLYAQMLRLNLYRHSIGYVADRWSYGAGLEYAYMLEAGRRIRLSFGIGVGFVTGIYRKYKRMDGCDVWQSTARRSWFGPTKMELSFIWVVGQIGCPEIYEP